jgi:hypothetical protein
LARSVVWSCVLARFSPVSQLQWKTLVWESLLCGAIFSCLVCLLCAAAFWHGIIMSCGALCVSHACIAWHAVGGSFALLPQVAPMCLH